MSNNSFKIKNSAVLTPKDLTQLVSPEAGELACDINDNDKIKRYDTLSSTWVEVGAGGVGGVDILFVEDFESAGLNQFTQVGLSLSQVDPLKGRVSAVLNHQAGTSPANDQFFKQVKPVDRKFRGENMVLRFDVKSDASQGNLVVKVYDETNAADIVASEQLQLSNDVSGTKSSVAFVIPSNCESISYTVTALPESGKVSRIDDVVCELARNEVVQSGLVQEGDSVLYANGNAGQTITAGVTPIPFNFQSMIGSDISWDGSTATINTSGIYEIVGYVGFTAAADQRITLFVNGVSSGYISTISSSLSSRPFSTSRYLYSGDQIQLRSISAGGTLSTSQTANYIYITKQGSLKQAAVASDQKITIPTSELRFEGASSRGSTATAIVKFDTLAKIRGDAFTIVNTAADGTYIQMNKNGKLNVSCTLADTVNNNSQFYISKNQQTLTLDPVASERLAAAQLGTTAAANVQNIAWSGFVQLGDIIRICRNINPTASSSNSLNLSFQEQEIQVSVSNTLPQFSESDSSIRLSGANGFGSSATTTRRFASVLQNIGNDIEYVDSPTLGGQFIAKSAGIYHVSYSEQSQANTIAVGVAIRLNGATLSYSGDRVNTITSSEKRVSTSWSGYLNVGDIITAAALVGLENHDGFAVNFTMSKVGKPNVTGVDVTPFVNVPQPESQSSLISGTGSVNSANFNADVIQSQGGGIYSLSGNTITILKACSFNLSFSAIAITTDTYISILYNGDTIGRERARNTSNLSSAFSVSCNLIVNVGDVLECSSVGIDTTSYFASVLATALSDQILTPPETFSSDTATLQYAPSSSYTLSTLADAPVGTFITFTYAANTNTRTQTTTAPTQSVSDMNANGMLIYTRAYNAASTAALPAVFAVQIGKGLKGLNINGYGASGKSNQCSLDLTFFNSEAARNGLQFKDYNEITGVLLLDAGYNMTASVTSAGFRGAISTSILTSGYLVINASKNPALTGLNSETVSARVVNTAGTSIGSADTKIVFNSSASIVNNMTIDNANNRIYAPHSGIYWIDAGVQFASAAYTAGHQLQIKLYKNGVYYSTLAAKTVDAAVTQKQGLNGSDQIRLAKGDYIEFYASNARGATALSTTAGECYMNITKKGL